MTDRKAYQQKMEAQLKEWHADLDKLAARAEKKEAHARLEFNRLVQDLRHKYQTLQTRFSELAAAGESKFETLRSGFEHAVTDFREAFQRISTPERETSVSAKR